MGNTDTRDENSHPLLHVVFNLLNFVLEGKVVFPFSQNRLSWYLERLGHRYKTKKKGGGNIRELNLALR